MELGIDLIEVERIEKLISDYPARFINRVFTKEEINYCESASPKLKAQRYAARFAALGGVDL